MFFKVIKLLWRNWLARSAVNRKDGGSSPPRSEIFFPFLVLFDCNFNKNISRNIYVIFITTQIALDSQNISLFGLYLRSQFIFHFNFIKKT